MTGLILTIMFFGTITIGPAAMIGLVVSDLILSRQGR